MNYQMKMLYNNHILITPGGVFGTQGNKYIRVSLCSKKEVFEEAIKRVKFSVL